MARYSVWVMYCDNRKILMRFCCCCFFCLFVFFVVVFLLFDISINLYHVWIYKFACTFLLKVQISEPKRLTKQHFCVVKGLVTPANGYVPEGKRTKICRIWLSGDKIYLLCRSKFSRSVCGAWKLSNDRTSTGHVTEKTHENRMCTG